MQVERYEQFFGFQETPFSLAPNPRYLFESASHAAALAQVAYAIERREPLVVVTGEIGTGKTLLCRTVLHRLVRKTFVSVVNNSLLGPDDLLKQLLQDFGVISKDRTGGVAVTRHDLVHALEDFLTSLIALDAHAVVLIDEAQHIQPEVLEQIRLLSNIDDRRGTMLQIILVGQADLESLLARPELRQFQQRVSRRVRLEPLGADELQPYIEHRLAVGRAARQSTMPGADELARELAEWEDASPQLLFAPDAIQAIWKISGGLPRVVNILCDRALEAACAQRMRMVDASFVNAAALALDLEEQPAPVERSSEPEPVNAPDDPIPAAIESAPTIATPRGKKKMTTLVATSIAVAALSAVAVWFGMRGSNQADDRQRDAQPAGPAPSVTPAGTRSTPAFTSTVPAPVRPASAATPSESVSTGSAADDGKTTDGRFDIVIASFRTESRAASVAADVSSLGLPVRRRVAVDWQQVVAGPFASRSEAEQAQRRLERAGLTDTQVVLAGR